MATMYWSSRFRKAASHHYSSRNPEFRKEIHDWRLLSCGYISSAQYGLIEGMFLLTDRCWFLPSMKVEQLIDHTEKGKDHTFEHYHFAADGHQPPFCYKCKGGGKLDWLSKITGVPGLTNTAVKKFKRDPSCALQYVDLLGELKNHQWLGVTSLQEGEELCHTCLGTGIMLDGRFKIFSEKRFKNRLIRVKMSEAIENMKG